jgi:hypothetical protein
MTASSRGWGSSTTVGEAHEIMSQDPAIKAQVLIYELHPTRSFAGSTLPDAGIGNADAPS